MENRRTENEVIVISDDESTTGQSAEKNARRRAVCAATASKTARQATPNILGLKRTIIVDSKKEMEDELQKRLAELSTQLEEARKRVEEATAREMNAARESDAAKHAMIEMKRMMETAEKEKDQLAKDKFALEQELEETKRKVVLVNSPNDDLVFANFALTTELDASRKKAEDASIVNEKLSRENAAHKDQFIEAKREADAAKKLRRENSELKEQLDKAMRSERLVKKNENKVPIEFPVVKRELDRARGTPDGVERRKRMLSTIDQHIGRKLGSAPKRWNSDAVSFGVDSESINIFQMVRPGARDTISVDDAIKQLSSKYYNCGYKMWNTHCRDSCVKFECGQCNKSMNMKDVVLHFISNGHDRMVRGGAISQPAVDHWLRELQKAMDGDAAVGAASAADAASAASAADAAGATSTADAASAADAAGAAAGRSDEPVDSAMQEHVQAPDN